MKRDELHAKTMKARLKYRMRKHGILRHIQQLIIYNMQVGAVDIGSSPITPTVNFITGCSLTG